MPAPPCPVCASESTEFGRFHRCSACQCVFDPSQVYDVERENAATQSQTPMIEAVEAVPDEPAGQASQSQTETETDQAVPVPGLRKIEDSRDGRLTLQWRWRSAARQRRAWLSASLVLVTGPVAALLLAMGDRGLVGYVICGLLFGCATLYTGIATLLNTLTIEVREHRLELRHGPLPHPRNRALSLPTSEIEQLWVIQEPSHPDAVGVRRGFRVMLRERSGDERTLLEDLDNAEHARHIEQLLESHLRIVDRPVVGELPIQPSETLG